MQFNSEMIEFVTKDALKCDLNRFKQLGIENAPFSTMFLLKASGILDGHFPCRFIIYDAPPEGFKSVIDRGLGEQRLETPFAAKYEKY